MLLKHLCSVEFVSAESRLSLLSLHVSCDPSAEASEDNGPSLLVNLTAVYHSFCVLTAPPHRQNHGLSETLLHPPLCWRCHVSFSRIPTLLRLWAPAQVQCVLGTKVTGCCAACQKCKPHNPIGRGQVVTWGSDIHSREQHTFQLDILYMGTPINVLKPSHFNPRPT